jgi:hypothetical protein
MKEVPKGKEEGIGNCGATIDISCVIASLKCVLIVVSLRMPQEFVGLPCLETAP